MSLPRSAEARRSSPAGRYSPSQYGRPAIAMRGALGHGGSAVPDGHADGGHEHAAERHLHERARERDLEVALAHERDDDELAADDDVGDRQRLVEVVDEERQRVQRPAEERREARDEPA